MKKVGWTLSFWPLLLRILLTLHSVKALSPIKWEQREGG